MRRGPMPALLAVAVLSGSALIYGCFDRPTPECAFFCGPAGECPDNYACAADGWCKHEDVDPAFQCPNAPADAAVPDAPVADAPIVDDAVPPDAPPPDADLSPTITQVDPTGGPLAGGTVVTITGTGFQDNDPGENSVTFGGVAATNVTVTSDTALTATTPAGVAAGSVDVVVTNDNGSATLTDGFEYFAEPTVTDVDPASGSESGGLEVTITGTGFLDNDAGAATVLFGANPADNVVVVSDTSITADTPAGAPGAVDVAVTNNNGTGTLQDGFTYLAD